MTTLAPSAASLLQSVRDLRPLIEAEAEQIERDHRITTRVIEALREAGVYRMLTPRVYGGSQLTLWEFAAVMEAIAEADASTAWTVGQNSGICRLAAYMPPEGAREIFGDPNTILSWGNGPGTARKVDGGYVINFQATYSSGMHHATWLGTQDCDTYDAAGNLVLNKHGEKLRGTCFFRPEDVQVREIWQVSGLKGTGTDCYTVTDLFVPEHRFAFEEPVVGEPLYLYNTTNIFATGFAAVALGLARATLDALIDITATKSARGASGPLRDQRPIQARLGVAEATLRSARALLARGRLGWLGAREHDARTRSADARRVAHGDHVRHAARSRGRGHRLQAGGHRRHLREERLRAPLPRHARRLAAHPGPRRSLREGRPVPHGPRAGQRLAVGNEFPACDGTQFGDGYETHCPGCAMHGDADGVRFHRTGFDAYRHLDHDGRRQSDRFTETDCHSHAHAVRPHGPLRRSIGCIRRRLRCIGDFNPAWARSL